jgi:hypothetical protein
LPELQPAEVVDRLSKVWVIEDVEKISSRLKRDAGRAMLNAPSKKAVLNGSSAVTTSPWERCERNHSVGADHNQALKAMMAICSYRCSRHDANRHQYNKHLAAT